MPLYTTLGSVLGHVLMDLVNMHDPYAGESACELAFLVSNSVVLLDLFKE